MEDSVREKVISYVNDNYKNLSGKDLIIKELDNVFRIVSNKDKSPLFLSKKILD